MNDEGDKHGASSPSSLIQISDLFGLKVPATELVRAIVSGVGWTIDLLSRKYNAKQNIDIVKMWQTELSVQEDSPRHVEVSIGERAGIRLQFQERRHQVNRENIAIRALKQAQEDRATSFDPAGQAHVEFDWVDIFWRYSENVSDDDLQEIWARILVGKTLRARQYSVRLLHLMSTLTKDEAVRLQRIAGFVTLTQNIDNLEYEGGIITSFAPHHFSGGTALLDDSKKKMQELEKELRLVIGDYGRILFGSIGIYGESGFAHSFALSPSMHLTNIKIGDTVLRVEGFGQKYAPPYHTERQAQVAVGTRITPLGQELFKLADAKANAKYLLLITRGLELQGLKVTIS